MIDDVLVADPKDILLPLWLLLLLLLLEGFEPPANPLFLLNPYIGFDA